jgi:hypothetical protein
MQSSSWAMCHPHVVTEMLIWSSMALQVWVGQCIPETSGKQMKDATLGLSLASQSSRSRPAKCQYYLLVRKLAAEAGTGKTLQWYRRCMHQAERWELWPLTIIIFILKCLLENASLRQLETKEYIMLMHWKGPTMNNNNVLINKILVI